MWEIHKSHYVMKKDYVVRVVYGVMIECTVCVAKTKYTVYVAMTDYIRDKLQLCNTIYHNIFEVNIY